MSDPSVYVTLDAMKSSLSISDFNFIDDELIEALASASRAVDAVCDRRFYLADASNDQTRYYTPLRPVVLEIDDCVSLTSVQTDQDGDGTFETTLVLGTDFELGPDNADLNGKPWERLVMKQRASSFFPVGGVRAVQVVGSFGWTEPPDRVVTLTKILASRLLQRVRMAPFGAVSMGVESAIRIAREDPDLVGMVRGLDRAPLFVG